MRRSKSICTTHLYPKDDPLPGAGAGLAGSMVKLVVPPSSAGPFPSTTEPVNW
ncbi:hypothetical protein HY573_01900 [Candidatus Parcubacteria bacterium]|nr:hypothetical protein [Candidatus Parcubacteria bacterium]